MDNGYDANNMSSDGLAFEQPEVQEEQYEQPFPEPEQKKGKNGWMIATIISLVLFVAASVAAGLFFAKGLDTKETDALKSTISDKDAEIAKASEEKTSLEKQVENLKTEVDNLRSASNAGKNATPKTKPANITDSEVKEASKKLGHELAAGYKVLINSDFQYVVVEGIELSTGAGMYIYKSNTADAEWKFLLVTQSILSCEEASSETKLVLKGIASCENSNGDYDTF